MITKVFDARLEGDVELVARAKAGDQEAFVELCDRHRLALKRRIHRIVQNQHDAEDILQECMLRAYTKLAGFRGRCAFQTWVTRIAINCSLMHLRTNRRMQFYASLDLLKTDGERIRTFDVPDPSPNPEQIYVENQARVKLSRAVEELPPVSRCLVKQYHQQERTLLDVAHALRITLPAAKARLFRARKLLRRRLAH